MPLEFNQFSNLTSRAVTIHGGGPFLSLKILTRQKSVFRPLTYSGPPPKKRAIRTIKGHSFLRLSFLEIWAFIHGAKVVRQWSGSCQVALRETHRPQGVPLQLSGIGQAVIRKSSRMHCSNILQMLKTFIQKASNFAIAIQFHFDFAHMLYEFLCFEVALTSENNMAEL